MLIYLILTILVLPGISSIKYSLGNLKLDKTFSFYGDYLGSQCQLKSNFSQTR